MAQNQYDDAAFFEAYAGLRRSQRGLEAAPEWPTSRSLLPDLVGARVIDLGCGYGWFCRWAAAAGASTVTGYDISQRMLDRAEEMTDANALDATITYERADLETLRLAPDSADVVYSSLTLHYLADVDQLAAVVSQALVPGGTFVFTVEHPIASAPRHAALVTGPNGSEVWPLDAYPDEGARVRNWLGADVVKFHRTTATYVNALIDAGLQLVRIVDWVLSVEQVVQEPLWAVDRKRPTFLILAVRRPDELRPDESRPDELLPDEPRARP